MSDTCEPTGKVRHPTPQAAAETTARRGGLKKATPQPKFPIATRA